MSAQSPTSRSALGLVELRGELAGFQLLDIAIKHGGVGSAFGRPVCPGKFLVFLSGSVATVRSALAAGVASGVGMQTAPVVLSSVHADVWPALTGTTDGADGDGLAVLETYSASSAVLAADAVAKAAGVQLLRIRLASGLGGKGVVFLSGLVADLREAEVVAQRVAGDHLLDSRVLASPHPRVWQFVL
jgi:microcompartment protein CcmL/EutN